MTKDSRKELLAKIDELKRLLVESDQLIEAIKKGEVDAFAISNNETSEVFTLQSGDYAYRVLIEEIEESALNVTEDGLIVYSNPCFIRLLNLPYDKVIGKNIFDFISVSSKEDFNKLFNAALQGKSKGEVFLVTENNKIPVYASLTSLQPKLSTIGILFTDLTERKKAEQEIKDQNLFINNLTSIFPDMINVQDYPSRKMIYYNREPFKIIGFDIDDLLMMSVDERNNLIHPDDRAEMMNYMSSFRELTNEEYITFEYRAKNKMGDWVWLRTRGKVFDRNPDGSVKSILNVIQNITPNKIVELQLKRKNEELEIAYENLKKSKEHFTLLFQVSPVAKSLTEADSGTIVDVNPAWEKMFRRSKEEVVGKSGAELGLLTKDDRDKEAKKILEISGKIAGNEFDFIMRDDTILHTSISETNIEIDGTEYYLTAFFDITERKQAEEQIIESANLLKHKNIQLQEINEELESFNYIASHDLQEPLRKIETFLHLIKKNHDNAEKSERYIEKTIESANRMSALIQSVLNYSRITKSKQDEYSQTDLNKVFDNVRSDFELKIKEKQAIIKADVLPVITASPMQMHQLFSNLLSNALKFTNQHPVINVTSKIVDAGFLESQGIKIIKDKFRFDENSNYKGSCDMKFVEINFSDNGIGFESQFSKKIFDLFQRLHGNSKYTGTGIGLSIAKKIIDHHNGFITAHSELNRGSTFTFWLPVKVN